MLPEASWEEKDIFVPRVPFSLLGSASGESGPCSCGWAGPWINKEQPYRSF